MYRKNFTEEEIVGDFERLGFSMDISTEDALRRYPRSVQKIFEALKAKTRFHDVPIVAKVYPDYLGEAYEWAIAQGIPGVARFAIIFASDLGLLKKMMEAIGLTDDGSLPNLDSMYAFVSWAGGLEERVSQLKIVKALFPDAFAALIEANINWHEISTDGGPRATGETTKFSKYYEAELEFL